VANLSEELKIVISGDPKKFNKALDEALAGTARLEAGASAVAKVSAVAFAALTGTVTGLVAAFREQEIQEQKTNAILKAQGDTAKVTATEVFGLAAALQQVTIYGDEVILEAENMLIGLVKLTDEGLKKATEATLDLATFMGTDAVSAAAQLGKALADPAQGLAALGRAGVKFSDDQQRAIKAMAQTGNTAGAQNVILQTLSERVGGLARASVEGSGRLVQLRNSIGEVGEAIGKQLTPKIAKAAEFLIPFVNKLGENEEFSKTAAAILLTASAVTGLVTAVAGAVKAFTVLRGFAIATAATLGGITLAGAAIAVGIGALIVVVTDLALNWDKRTSQMSAAFTAFVDTIIKGGAALNDFLYNLATGNFSKAKDALTEMGGLGTVFADSYSKSMAKAGYATVEAVDGEKNGVIAKDKETKDKLITANVAYLETLKKLDDEYKNLRMQAQMSGNEQELIAEQEHRNALLEAANEYRRAIVEGQISDQQIDAEQELAFQTQMAEMRNELRAAEINSTRAAALEKAQIQQKADLQYLKDREKFGVTFAKINQVINSQYVQGAAQAAGELVALQQSTNSTLKAIGKAAAIADITIKTAQSAMNIYNGFSTIPIVGPALGIAGAAAAVAFGAERLRAVTAAAQGGVMTGGIPGRDSIPTLTMPGELVTPTKNFDEVVNAVADARLAERGQGAAVGGGEMHVVIGFQDDAFRIIEQKLIERRVLGV
jgi:hypothetical protein